MATLDELRDDIDRVDEVLVRLLNERARVACEIGRIKKQLGIEVYQPEREQQVLAHVRSIGCSNASSTRRVVSSAASCTETERTEPWWS